MAGDPFAGDGASRRRRRRGRRSTGGSSTSGPHDLLRAAERRHGTGRAHRLAGVRTLARRLRRRAARRRRHARRARRCRRRRRLGRPDALDRERALRAAQLQQRRRVAVPDGLRHARLYANGRPDAGWLYLDGLADLAFIESRGYTPELFSGDRLRSIDAAVPHQLFATTGFMSGAHARSARPAVSTLIAGDESGARRLRRSSHRLAVPACTTRGDALRVSTSLLRTRGASSSR